MEQQTKKAYVKAEYGGFEVTIELPLPPDDLRKIIESLEYMREIGFSPRGQQPEETRTEAVNAVVVRETAGGTPVVAFYSPNEALDYKVTHTYVDTEELRRAIEEAAGVNLDEVLRYPHEAFPRRSKAGKYLIQTKAFTIKLGVNPKWYEWSEKSEEERAGTPQPQKWVLRGIIGAQRKERHEGEQPEKVSVIPPEKLTARLQERATQLQNTMLSVAERQEVLEKLKQVVGDSNIQDFAMRVFGTQKLSTGALAAIRAWLNSRPVEVAQIEANNILDNPAY